MNHQRNVQWLRGRAHTARAQLILVLFVVLFGGLDGSVFAATQTTETVPRPATQPVSVIQLSLEEAIARAERASEEVAIAEAGVRRAVAEERRAASERLPQILASASYDRTLASEFSGLFGGGSGSEPCPGFTLNRDASLDARVAEIERAIDCGAIGNPFSGGGDDGLNELPFGRENIYRVNVSFGQNLFSGGRITAQRTLARTGRETADLSLTTARAQMVLDVTEAYYDAVLSDRLITIAEATLKQAEATVVQIEQGHQAGRTPEFEVLRARVARDNQRPLLVRARASRTIVYLRLKQLLEVPASADVQLESDLDDPALPPPPPFAAQLVNVEQTREQDDPDTRLAVRQAEAAVRASEAGVQIARSQRLPTVSLNSLYGRVAYPSTFPGFDDFRTNWTVGIAVQIPLFTGGRLKSEEVIAETRRFEADERLQQTRELALLDRRAALEELESARATVDASIGTVAQAVRAHEIAELRFREGISTQLELSDARLLLAQAQAIRAQAARDLQVARARIALLPNLPLGTGGSLGGAGGTSSQPGSSMPPGSAPQPSAPSGDVITQASSGGLR